MKINYTLIFLIIILNLSITVNSCEDNTQKAVLKTSSQLEKEEIKIMASADSYVSSRFPSTNFGDSSVFKAGVKDNQYFYKSYLCFNLDEKSDNWDRAEISINVISIDNSMDINIYLVEEEWGEMDIKWDKRPSNGGLIDTIEISTEEIYKIDVTEYIKEQDTISICLSTNSSAPDYITFTSEESITLYKSEHPYLIWIEEEKVGFDIKSPSTDDVFGIGPHNIEWKSYSDYKDVEIQLFSEEIYIKTLSSRTENDGKFKWEINILDNYEGDTYQIKIIDSEDDSVFEYSDYFMISMQNDQVIYSLSIMYIIIILSLISISVCLNYVFIKKYKEKISKK